MKNFFTRLGFRSPLYLLFAVCLVFAGGANKVNAQCSVGEYATLATAASGCSAVALRGTGSGGLGAGESQLTPLVNGVWYTFTFTNNAQSNGVCVNGTQYTTSPEILQWTASSGNYYVGMYRNSTTWTATSATLSYEQTTPTEVSAGAGTYCAGSYAVTNTPTHGTSYWQGTTSGNTSTTTSATSETVSSSGTYYYNTDNNGCWSGTIAEAVTIDAALAASITGSSTICYNTTPATLTATASGGSGSGYTYLWYANGTSTSQTSSTYSPGSSLTTTTTAYTASNSWVVPSGVGSATVYLWGGGGGGGGTTETGSQAAFANGGGGGGGACSVNTQAVSGGQTWTVTIGAGGTAGSGAGGTGGTTTFVNGSTTLSASGGGGGAGDASGSGTFAGGAGGSAGTGTVYAGGTGSTSNDASGITGTGGGGGGSSAAGTSPASACSVTGTGGTGTYAGGTGGYNSACSSESSCTTGPSGSQPGGGGAGDNNWTCQANGGTGGAGEVIISYGVATPTTLTSTGTYYCVVTNSCGSVTSSTTTVTVDANLTASQTGGSTNICYNTTPSTFTASGSGGTSSYTYLWYLNGSSTGVATNTYSPGNLTATSTVYCAVTSGSCGTVNTTAYTVAVNGNLTSSQTGGSTNICYNTTPSTFTASGSGGTGSYTYLWYINSGSTGVTSSTYSPGNLTATSTVYCAVTSGSCGTVNTTAYTVAVNGNLTSSQTGGSTNICYNTTPTAFTASGSGGTGSYTYLWYLNGGATGVTSSTYSPGNLTATSTVYCAVTSGSCGTVNTTAYTVTVYGSFTSSQTGGSTNICYNTTPTAFTASGSGGTSSYTYLWYLNGSSTGVATNTYSPGNLTATSTVYCAVTSGSCGTSNTTAYTVAVDGNFTVSQTGGSTNICYNTTPTAFTASGSGGTGSYTYLWYKNGTSTGTATNTYSPGNLTATTTIYCAVTSGSCGTVNTTAYTVVVNGNLTASQTGGSTNICYNTTPSAFTASGSGGTGSYSYLWYLNGGSTGISTSTYSPGNLTATSTVYCAVTSGSCGTVNTTAYTVTVDGNFTVSQTGGSTNICYNTTPTAFTASGSGGTGSYTYLWYLNGGSTGTSTNTYSASNLTATSTIYCAVTSGSCGTVNTTAYTVAVDGNLTASQTGGSTNICYNTAPSAFTASGSGGTGSYTYLWYLNGGSSGITASTYSPGNLTGTSTVYCAITSGSCGTANTTAYTVTVDGNLTASQTGGSTNICYNTTPSTFTASGSGGTGSYTYLWYKNGSSTGTSTNTYSPGNLTATATIYCAVTSGSCGTSNTTPYTVTVDANLTAGISGGTSPSCYNTDPGTLTATGNGGTGSYAYQWYNTSGSIGGATNSTYDPGTLTASNTYSCSVTSGSCGTVSTGNSVITIEPAVSSYGTVNASGGYTQTVCDNVPPNNGTAFTVTGAAGSSGLFTYQWYYQSGLVSAPSGSSTSGWTAVSTGSGYNSASFIAAGTHTNITYACFVIPASPVCGSGQWAANDVQVTVLSTGPYETSYGGASVCLNGTVTLTSNLSVVISSTYQWYSSTSIGFSSPTTISGATSTSYAPPTTASGTLYYEIVATFAGSGCNPATSNVQTVQVYTAPTASQSGGATPICYNNDPGVFTATGSGGSGSFTYQWYNSSSSVGGATNSTYDPGNLTASNTYNCTVTDAAGCGVNSTTPKTITVDGNLTAAISGGTTPICYNADPGVLTATGGGGTGTYSYQWYNGSGSVSGATSSTYDPGSLTASNSYFCAITSGSCGTVNTGVVNITVHAIVSGVAGGGSSPICYNTAPGTIHVIASGGTGTYTYQWYNTSGSIGGANASTYAPGALTASNSYYCVITSGTCGSANSNTISITVDAILSAGISGGATPICYNTDPGVFTATASGGTGTYTYQWYHTAGSISGATASTYDPGNITASDGYYCSVTSGTCGTATTGTTSITVDATLTAGISGGTSPICYNTDPGIFTATGSGGTGTYTYQWYNGGGSVGGATSSTYDPGNLTVSNSYHCSVTSGSCGTVSTSTTPVTVDATLTASISGGVSPICYNTDPGALTATGSGGTGTYTYQWYHTAGSIGGATASTYDPGNITASDAYYCSVTSGSCGTASTGTTSITVDATLTASISGGTTPICYNTDPGTLKATGSGGTGTYTYQWYHTAGSIGGATASTYDPGNITASDAYYCSVTSGSCGTATTGTTSITVDATLTAGISGGTSPICYNTDPGIFTATGSGGSGAYTYQWYNGGGSVGGATSSTYDPGNLTVSNSYHCSVTSGSCGTVSTSTTPVTVDATLTAAISGGMSPICYNTDPGALTATGSGGTGTYTYQWYHTAGSIGGATASTYDPGNITASDAYHCSVTSGSCGTASTGTTSITVDATLTASISGGTTPICYNTDPGALTATGSGGTGTYTYQWYHTAGSIGGATASTYDPGNITASDAYYCSVTSGSCGTATTGTTSVTVDATFTAGISGGTSPICYNTDPGIFTATGSGGSGAYVYQWYDGAGSVSGATASTYDPGNITSSNAYRCSVTSGSCGTVSTGTTPITVDGNLTAGISGGTSPICYNTDPGVFTITGSGGTGTYTYQWYNGSGSIGGATASTYDPGSITASDAYYCSITSGGCGTASSGTTSVTVDATLTAGISGGTTPICYNTDPGIFTATGSGGGGTYTYQWYNGDGMVSGATSGTYDPGNLTGGNSYYCSVSSGSCGSTVTSTITIAVSPVLIPVTPTVSANPVCITTTGGGTNIQVAGSVSGDGYQLQTSLGANVGSAVTGTGGTINLPTGSMAATTTYQVFATDVASGCSSTTPANITVNAVNPDIAFGAQISGQHYTFGTIGSPALPSGWSTPANSNSNAWGLATANPASSGSYSYFNGSGGTSSASTGAYIQTPTGALATTPTVDLITGVINATGYTNISVQWGVQKSAGYTGAVNLYYSLDGGSTWSSAVSFTDAQANVTGAPWSLVNNTVQVKLPAAVNNQTSLMLKWSANPSTDGSYYSMNDIGIYGLGKIVNCGTSSISLPYLNTSCSVNEYSLTADATNPWPSSPAFSYVSGTGISGSPISIAVPTGTASGTYNLDITVDDGAGHSSGTVSFPVNVDLLINATVGLDNCSCNYTTSGGIGGAYGNIVTVYASGGVGTGFYFTSGGVVDTLLSTTDAGGTTYSGTANHSGVKGIFWSKADGASHSYTISDGYCSTTGTKTTQSGTPSAIPFGNATGQPTAITTGSGGGNGISGSFNNSGTGDPNISNVNGPALTCHQTADFGNNWVVYQVNNLDGSGLPVAHDSTNNKAVVEINNNGNDLDSVQVSVYRDANLPVVPNAATHTTACYDYPGYGMERHFMIKSNKSTGANVFSNNPVGVRLYFTDAEFQDIAYWTLHVATTATGESASCAYLDTVTNLNSIYVTKYTGTNEDGDYSNNSPSGLYRLFGKNLVNTGDGPLTVDGGAATLTTGGATNLHYVQMNVTEFSEFWLGGSSGGQALPVEMIYLEAEALNNDSIQVRWGTQTEINNREFDVERSTDGNTWSTIGVVAGHDNSVVEEDYAYNDLSVVPGTNYYYRLKQIDNNGNYQYTGIVQAQITGAGAFAVMNFVPNPTTGSTQLTVVATKEQEITIDFYDMLGQKVLSSVEQIAAGTNRMSFDLERFAAGTYSAVVTSENQLYTKKIVIAK